MTKRKTATVHRPPTRHAPSTVAPTKAKPDRHFFDWRFMVTIGVLFGLSLGFAGFSRSINPSGQQQIIGQEARSLFGHLGQLVSNRDRPLKGEEADRINVLLLGIGGSGHEGAYLADTIMLVSLKPSTGQLALVSIPRDFYVPIPGHDWRKINNANAFGREDQYPGGGELLTADILSNILNINIPYVARVDFAGFKKIVDDLNGVSVNVTKGFVDTEYPTENYGYQTIRFQAGTQTMNGDQALKYARSRKSTSDFDRSRRQQDILLAIREKALSAGTLLNPLRISDVLTDLGTHTRTNLELWELFRFADFAERLPVDSLVNRVLDSGPNSPLVSDRTQDGAYILRPRAGWDDWDDLRAVVRDIFESPTSVSGTNQATIVVQNGTTQVRLADRTATALEKHGFTVSRRENATNRKTPTTQLYNLSKQDVSGQLARLKLLLPSVQVQSSQSLFLNPDALPDTNLAASPDDINSLHLTEPLPDFLLVLGNDNAVDNLLNPTRGQSNAN